MTTRRWWLVSDLHLGPGQPDTRYPAAAFARFLDEVVAAGPPRGALVLLGDAFEVPGLDGPGACARLADVAAAHPEVFDALRRCLASGVRLHVVAGNHDSGLVRPAAGRLLRELLGDTGGGRVRIHPWALHVPGVLFAEHGHQHHAVHRLPTMLVAGADDHAPLAPSALTVWGRRAAGPLGTTIAVCRALTAARAAEACASRPGYRGLVAAEAKRLGLSPDTGRALWRVSRFRLLPAVAITGARVLRRLVAARLPTATEPGPDSPEGAPPFAVQVAVTLAAHGAAVAWYVTGHTHRAGTAAVPGTSTRWANTGTWCSDIRGPGPDRDDHGLFPYLTVDATGDGAVTGTLAYWRVPAEALPRHTLTARAGDWRAGGPAGKVLRRPAD
jgi:hypothetical protein